MRARVLGDLPFWYYHSFGKERWLMPSVWGVPKETCLFLCTRWSSALSSYLCHFFRVSLRLNITLGRFLDSSETSQLPRVAYDSHRESARLYAILLQLLNRVILPIKQMWNRTHLLVFCLQSAMLLELLTNSRMFLSIVTWSKRDDTELVD